MALPAYGPIPPIPVGASITGKRGSVYYNDAFGNTYLLNTASGSVLTLPTAIGSGAKITIIVSATVTSNSHKVLAASASDLLQGSVNTGDSGVCTLWNAALSATYNSLQLNGSTTGGFQGDYFTFTDIAVNAWQVTGTTKSTGTAATPFSTADS